MSALISPSPIFLALLHYPMQNRTGEVIATAVTNLDLHDIARTCRTYGIQKYFVVTPVEEQHKVVGRILNHWKSERNQSWHPDRFEALSRVELVTDFEAVKNAIKQATGQLPEVVLTDARPIPNSVSYSAYRKELKNPERDKPTCVVFGTGWGVSDIFYPEVHRILAPIHGKKDDPAGEYNHLSVRAAVAIILDRLLGEE